ncbi:microtubule-associated tyrosine carboxypeptidase 1 isoform X2 [Dryobates pubescens]|uniref:microtubule-associated tyrosine carboxypeptidase 1 isoform X2 n=1 Tax=Dryobates pubescens TaxID=118200 RepID=UPI0023B97980|nr:microtubule-associated tyrosine carboxypeptidase 1 isoform X2 [Dryobates pubescens]
MVQEPGRAAGEGRPESSAAPPLCSCPSPPAPPARCPRGSRRLSETGSGLRRSESASAGGRGRLRAAASLPHIARGRGAEEGGGAGRRSSPCLLVALRPRNVEAERERFFRASFAYDPQFEYAEPLPAAVLDKYGSASDRFVTQALRIIQAVLKKYGTYESFEVATGGRLLSKCQIWSIIRKYLQKEGCLGEGQGDVAGAQRSPYGRQRAPSLRQRSPWPCWDNEARWQDVDLALQSTLSQPSLLCPGCGAPAVRMHHLQHSLEDLQRPGGQKLSQDPQALGCSIFKGAGKVLPPWDVFLIFFLLLEAPSPASPASQDSSLSTSATWGHRAGCQGCVPITICWPKRWEVVKSY